jgi:nicotinic acid mononucleotide adenylyltransferase
MSFKKYLEIQNAPSIIFSFGRFNPPHKEHGLLFDDLEYFGKKEKIQDVVLFTSFTQNAKKNPLNPQDKIFYLRKMVGEKTKVSDNQSLKSPFAILEDLIKNKNYQRIIFLVGEDRVSDFQRMYKYAEDWGDELGKYIDFKIQKRKGSRTKGISGTAMRNFAKENDFESFKDMLDSSLQKYAMEIFKKTREGLNVV